MGSHKSSLSCLSCCHGDTNSAIKSLTSPVLGSKTAAFWCWNQIRFENLNLFWFKMVSVYKNRHLAPCLWKRASRVLPPHTHMLSKQCQPVTSVLIRSKLSWSSKCHRCPKVWVSCIVLHFYQWLVRRRMKRATIINNSLSLIKYYIKPYLYQGLSLFIKPHQSKYFCVSTSVSAQDMFVCTCVLLLSNISTPVNGYRCSIWLWTT